MEFESVPLGNTWGGPDLAHNAPGDVVLIENGIEMSVEWFYLNQFSGFYWAEVVGPENDHQLAIDNISVMFDLTNVGFNVTSLTIEYLELGGSDNFAVNGGSILQPSKLIDLPAGVAGGVTLSQLELDPHTHRTRITLTGDVDNFLIGGQELIIDSIIVVPEPTSLLLLGMGGMLTLRRFRRGSLFSRKTPQ